MNSGRGYCSFLRASVSCSDLRNPNHPIRKPWAYQVHAPKHSVSNTEILLYLIFVRKYECTNTVSKHRCYTYFPSCRLSHLLAWVHPCKRRSFKKECGKKKQMRCLFSEDPLIWCCQSAHPAESMSSDHRCFVHRKKWTKVYKLTELLLVRNFVVCSDFEDTLFERRSFMWYCTW